MLHLSRWNSLCPFLLLNAQQPLCVRSWSVILSLKFVCNSRDYSFNLPTTLLTSHKRKIKVSSRGRQEMSLHKVHILYNLCHFKVSNSWIPLVCTCTFLSFGRAEVFHSDISLMYAWDHSGKGQETRSSWF